MNLQERIDILVRLGEYLAENNEEWKAVKQNAFLRNNWFTTAFIDIAVNNINNSFLQKENLQKWIYHYRLDDNINKKNIGIVMAGNIPLVGFHDFLCVFISGHIQTIKLSAKDDLLIKHLIEKMYDWNVKVKNYILFAELLKGCDAYIATGSNNSARYFEQYFSKYPNIIRHNRTSVAILNGKETEQDLINLSDDVHLYFGLGCRNVTKIYVPDNYDFVPLVNAFKRYNYLSDHNKYTNNYDYQLSLALLNNIYYMSSGSTLLIESEIIFSPVSRLNYEFYTNTASVFEDIKNNKDIQCVVGMYGVPLGAAQKPGLFDYADGIDVMEFLLTL
ncbi:MAG: acyl-CoA reductase [Chitinophagaceae bacterium]|nr:acyl-CoA reductase [Chitinophagaceae bacterium]